MSTRLCRLSSKQAAPIVLMEPIHVLGAGSIGLLWAASIRMAFPSYPIRLLLRERHRPRLNEQKQITVCIEQRWSKTRSASRIAHVPAEILSSMPSSGRPFRNLLLTTKAYQAVSAVTSVLDRIDDTTKLIVLCNGALAVRDELNQNLRSQGKRPCFHLAWTTHGAYRSDEEDDDEMLHVAHAGNGQTAIENYEYMSQLWDRAGLNCINLSTKAMSQQVWCKLAANCVINPLTAIHQCKNGSLLELPELEYTMLQLVREVAQVAQATVNDDTIDLREETLKQFVWQVLHDTSENKSSMLQDILSSRRTEIDYLNGFIVRKARELNLDCTVNSSFYDEICALTKGSPG